MSRDMHARMELPKAFSVRDEHEFLSFRHLMARLNAKLLVKQVATGVHVNGGGSVFWGLVYLNGDPPSRLEVENALREAGIDFACNVLPDYSVLIADAEVKDNACARAKNTGFDRALQVWEL
jgi:hypothetical protein